MKFFGQGHSCNVRWQETSTPTAVQLMRKISEHQIQHRSTTEATKPVNSLNKRQVLPVTHPAAPLVVIKFLSISLHSIPGLDSLPPTGRLPNCWSNWNRIASDVWTLQVSTRDSGSPIPGFHSGPTLLKQDEFCIDHG